MELNLAYIDLETTGTETETDRIVQIAAFKSSQDFSQKTDVRQIFINPGIPIPKAASDVHGITDEMVRDKPNFKQISKSLHEYLDGCHICGFNICNFDVPLLSEEFARVGIEWPRPGTLFIDTYRIFAEKEKRDLAGAVKFYLKAEHVDAHDAAGDILATGAVLFEQLRYYPDLGAMNLNQLHAFCEGEHPRVDLAGKIVLINGVACYSFGKHKGQPVLSQEGFAHWMLKNSFPTDTKKKLRQILFSKK
jgi:DNA polymerase-3 subunit epsilon